MTTSLARIVAVASASLWMDVSTGCGGATSHRPVEPVDTATVRWLAPSEMAPAGKAPGAHHRLLASHADGAKEYALILASGDDIPTALADFARDESVVAAHFTAIGAVRDGEVAWFDPSRKQYKAMRRTEQMEVVSLLGDLGVGADGKPAVHAHTVLGRSDGPPSEVTSSARRSPPPSSCSSRPIHTPSTRRPRRRRGCSSSI